MRSAAQQAEFIQVPRQVRFPVELNPPEGFDPERPETWPRVPGRLEYVQGRLLFMPPCGTLQGPTVVDVSFVLATWARLHPGFVVATNEAGMILDGETRAADAAVWLRRDQPLTGGLWRVAPLLAVEVAGESEPEAKLRDKAAWYLARRVRVVWIVLPESREALVLTSHGETRCRAGDDLPPHPDLPELRPNVDELFAQIAAE